MRSLLLIAVLSAGVCSCGGPAQSSDEIPAPEHWETGRAPTRQQVVDRIGQPVDERLEPPKDILTYCGETKDDGTGYWIYRAEKLREAHMKCVPQLELTFVANRLIQIEQTPGDI